MAISHKQPPPSLRGLLGTSPSTDRSSVILKNLVNGYLITAEVRKLLLIHSRSEVFRLLIVDVPCYSNKNQIIPPESKPWRLANKNKLCHRVWKWCRLNGQITGVQESHGSETMPHLSYAILRHCQWMRSYAVKTNITGFNRAFKLRKPRAQKSRQ